jgi:NAD(P)-dependent dehydrogenase (short-subunit alcohol dehydrogenase family)
MPRKILVTGAASGMGAALVRTLVADGSEVVALDRDAEGLEQMARGHPAIELLAVDLRDADQLRRALEPWSFGGVANVAGVGPDVDDARLIFEVNLLAPFLVLDSVVSRMPHGGAVVNVASIVAGLADDRLDAVLGDPLRPDVVDELVAAAPDGPAAYTYSKRGVLLTTRRQAVELADRIRLNVVSPGLIDTPMGARGLDHPWTKKLASRIPMQRRGQPEEVAAVVAFLLSDQASYLTGIEVPIDGGFTAGRHVGSR